MPKLWGGRFSQSTDKLMEAFSASIDYDQRLYAHDIAGSIAHCQMLADQNIILKSEADTLINGLKQIQQEIETHQFKIDPALEDIHMHIEHRLGEICGDIAKKLHTARSRNDQICLDIRMFLRDKTRDIITLIHQLRLVFVQLAQHNIHVIMPGYTHLQRAQPILFAHHMMAYYEMFTRDKGRFDDALKRINVMPLGSAALAGTTFPIDRLNTARRLNFPKISQNSMDSVADRDFVMEFLSCASICMVHLSRLSEELILWSSQEFNFITLSDRYTTGSSIMPQKKNPDAAELTRGKCGRIFGSLMAILTLMKGLPLAYNRDMQEDKEPLFDAIDTITACLTIYCQMLPEMQINEKQMRDACKTGYLDATDLADYLVKKGLPFREAHHVSGKIVQHAILQSKEISELSMYELKQFSSVIDNDLFPLITPESMINSRNCFGGTATQQVKDAIRQAQDALHEE
ncbi:MAG: Argininosuccinate lyase [Candidatus Magnetoglobus multicellularis str. Araruama]|uniref:Argininosuccinate lyase n=1 Tax=Candidatus Magnetoglobus multicellularis str. Araruama TaxID=890399 RepID=A0A1V1P8F7_9BACT|nr:MAG: Argininosuccinate lyase [Candidatus Magnetoglobus multicellularis str. Araruama]